MSKSFLNRFAGLGAALLVMGTLIGGATLAQAPAPAPVAPAAAQLPPDQLPTPRDADGHPILTGIWNGPIPGLVRGISTVTQGNVNINTFPGRGGNFRGFEEDGGLLYHDDPNKPVYKPQYWEQVRENDFMGNYRDPFNYCLPAGIPRLWVPAEIMKVEGQPLLLFRYAGRSQPSNALRKIYTDGRPAAPALVAAESWNGAPSGRWEGDTLVVESTGFTDSSWLEKGGYIHGFKMQVTERFTRKGNTMKWEAIVDDPEYFQEPWVWTPKIAYLNTAPGALVADAAPCDTRIHEGWGTEDEPLGSPVRSGTF